MPDVLKIPGSLSSTEGTGGGGIQLLTFRNEIENDRNPLGCSEELLYYTVVKSYIT